MWGFIETGLGVVLVYFHKHLHVRPERIRTMPDAHFYSFSATVLLVYQAESAFPTDLSSP